MLILPTLTVSDPRAELEIVQRELEGGAEDPRRLELEIREAQLLAAHGDAWADAIGILPRYARAWSFAYKSGQIDEVELRDVEWDAADDLARTIARGAPSMTRLSIQGTGTEAAITHLIAAMQLTRPLRQAWFNGAPVNAGALVEPGAPHRSTYFYREGWTSAEALEFLGSDAAKEIESLTLCLAPGGNARGSNGHRVTCAKLSVAVLQGGDAELGDFIEHIEAPLLRKLDIMITRPGEGPSGLARLFDCTLFDSLAELSFEQIQPRPWFGGVTRTASRLSKLSFGANQPDLPSLLSWSGLSNLRALDVRGAMDAENLRHVLHSPALENIVRLKLHVRDGGLTPFVFAPAPPNLRGLVLHYMASTEEEVRLFGDWSGLRGLRFFYFCPWNTPLHGVETLARPGVLENIALLVAGDPHQLLRQRFGQIFWGANHVECPLLSLGTKGEARTRHAASPTA